MRCLGSKFLLLSILTFMVGIGIVQVWQDLTKSKKLPETDNKIVPISKTSENIKLNQNNPCDQLKNISRAEKLDNKSPRRKSCPVAIGIINQRVCQPLPFRPIDREKEVEGKDYIIVHVTIDEEGFIKRADSATKSKFAQQAVKLSLKLRMPPLMLRGEPLHVSGGLLVFYPKTGLPKF